MPTARRRPSTGSGGPTDGGPRLGVAVVRGPSMGPALRDGDRLLVRYGRTPRVGDVVVARLADGTVAVKRAAGRRGGGWWLLGDAPEASVDSRHRGPVADGDVLAVVLARVWPRPRVGLRDLGAEPTDG